MIIFEVAIFMRMTRMYLLVARGSLKWGNNGGNHKISGVGGILTLSMDYFIVVWVVVVVRELFYWGPV